MRYVSTRGVAAPRDFLEILLEGLAPDGGLYMPRSYPQFDLDTFRGVPAVTYRTVAWHVMRHFAPDISSGDMALMLERVYRPEIFGSKEITPLQFLRHGLALLKLSEGKTLAFKDVPLQLLGALMEHALQKKNDTLNIVTATSGDTGAAAGFAVKGRVRQNLFILYPRGRTSECQRKMMTTLGASNVYALEVDAPFDRLQWMAKTVFDDLEFKKKYKVGAMNSINWARIAAQVVYYIYAYLKATKSNDQQVDFSVPTGNFGNALAAHVARQMGVPIRRIIVATNENDVLYDFFISGIYRRRTDDEVVPTTSPSMDIQLASNFERLIYDAADGDGDLVRDLWRDLKENGEFDGRSLLPALYYGWRSGRANVKEVSSTIARVYKEYGVIIDPHTAVGMHVGLQFCSPDVPLIVAETAHPAKFPDTIREALKDFGDIEPEVPESLRRVLELPETIHAIDPDPEALKRFIVAHV